MMNNNLKEGSAKRAMKLIGRGFLGGSIVASLVLSFTALAGRLGDTGSNYIGYWDIGIIGLGVFYGGPSGVALMCILRLVLFRIPNPWFLRITNYSGVLALISGMIGGLKNPFYAAIMCVGIFVLSMAVGGLVGSNKDGRSESPSQSTQFDGTGRRGRVSKS
ncbi:MAG TPA: hypothetical protein VNW30_05565 [Opitutaceae bacterium]|jgi:hypothetical protein|nr:hypothetical protein [Opitutaceae bacterium]